MKEFIKIIILSMGMVVTLSLIMFGISACNRSVKEAEFEQQFSPIIDFLDEEKKDFEGIRNYSSSVFTVEKNSRKEIGVTLDTSVIPYKGSIHINNDGSERKIPIEYKNGIQYSESTNIKFDEEIFNLVIEKEYFDSLKINRTYDSFETTSKDIVYESESKSDLFKSLISKYNLTEKTRMIITLGNRGNDSFNILIQLNDNEKVVQIDNTINLDRSIQ